MFDLQLEIKRWKQSFASVDSVGADDVDELESHLRELVSELRKRDLSEQEAFMVATQRLGNASELNGEFAKINGATVWRKRVLWMLCGFVAYQVGSAVIQSAATIASTGVALTGVGATATGATTIAIMLIGWAALLAIAYRQSKQPTAGPDRLSLAWGMIAGFALVFAYGLSLGGAILQANYVGMSEFGESQVLRGFGGPAIHLCVLVASVVLMWKLSEPKVEAVETNA